MKNSQAKSKDKGTEVSSSNLLLKNYDNQEDQLTKALLHVMDAGGFELLSALGKKFDLPVPENLIRTATQVAFHKDSSTSKRGSRPDGLIMSMPFTMLIESKIVKDCINVNQLNAHIDILKEKIDREESFLLYLTPDEKMPDSLNAYTEEGVYWISWANVKEFLKCYCGRYEYHNLQYLFGAFCAVYDAIFDNKANIPEDKLTVIVAGRIAEGRALERKIYNTQAGRTFRGAKYIAFYNNKKISHVFRIMSEPYQLLDSEYKDDFIYDLEEIPGFISEPIINDKKDKNGKPTPYTMGSPRYLSIDLLKIARTTNELDQLSGQSKK